MEVLELAFYRPHSELVDKPFSHLPRRSHRSGTAGGYRVWEPASASGAGGELAGAGMRVRAVAGRWLPPRGWTFPQVAGVGSRCVSVLCAHTRHSAPCRLRSERCPPPPRRAQQSSLTAGDCPIKTRRWRSPHLCPGALQSDFLGSGASCRRSCYGDGPGRRFLTWPRTCLALGTRLRRSPGDRRCVPAACRQQAPTCRGQQ